MVIRRGGAMLFPRRGVSEARVEELIEEAGGISLPQGATVQTEVSGLVTFDDEAPGVTLEPSPVPEGSIPRGLSFYVVTPVGFAAPGPADVLLLNVGTDEDPTAFIDAETIGFNLIDYDTAGEGETFPQSGFAVPGLHVPLAEDTVITATVVRLPIGKAAATLAEVGGSEASGTASWDTSGDGSIGFQASFVGAGVANNQELWISAGTCGALGADVEMLGTIQDGEGDYIGSPPVATLVAMPHVIRITPAATPGTTLACGAIVVNEGAPNAGQFAVVMTFTPPAS